MATSRRNDQRARPVIGWREWVALPEFGVPAIKAKVDTGARSSSLHAFDLEHFVRDGADWVGFTVHPLQREWKTSIRSEVPLFEMRVIRNPGGGGREELRPVVRTPVELMGRVWTIELTLTRRDRMGFRMLLGRSAVRRRFVIDPGKSFLAGKPQQRG